MSKAGRPKKGSLGLPKWFDIEKYRIVRSYGAAEWYQQLMFRAFVDFYTYPETPMPYGAECSALVKADPNITIERIKKACEVVPDEEVSQERALAAKSHIFRAMKLNAANGSGVRSMTYGEIKQAYHLPDLEYAIRNLKKGIYPDEQEMERKWIARWNDPYPGNIGDVGEIKYLHVDFSLPDPLLKRDFADYVRKQRKGVERPQSPFFKSQDFSVWYNSGALPYLDLRQWERETKETFRWSDFANALNDITDKSVGSDDACRKAAKSLAAKLLDIRTIRMLKFQAAKEQDGSRKKSGKLFVK